MWRLVADEKATLREIDEHWTIVDVLDANEALDVISDLTELARLTRPGPATKPPKQQGPPVR